MTDRQSESDKQNGMTIRLTLCKRDAKIGERLQKKTVRHVS